MHNGVNNNDLELISNYDNICKYIDYKLNLTDDPIKEFKSLCEYITTLNMSLENSIINKLINNNKFKNLLDDVINNYNKFSNVSFKNLVAYNIAITVIEAYSSRNNIELKINQINDSFNEMDFMDLKSYEDNYKIYINDIKKYKVLTKEETISLIKKIKQGDKDAKKLFICCNLRFVVSLAKNYTGLGLDFMDLIQEGNLGLIKAIDYYNVELGLTFTNYASYWIRQYILRAIENSSRNIRIPTYMHANIIKYNKAVTELEKTLFRIPTFLELATKLNISPSEVANLHKISKDTISLYTLVGEGTDSENKSDLIDFIEDSEDFVEEKIIFKLLDDDFKVLFKRAYLTEREKMVIIFFYGLLGDKMNFAEIARVHNISRERVRKLHETALKKLRNSSYTLSFINYMDSPSEAAKKIKMYRKN